MSENSQEQPMHDINAMIRDAERTVEQLDHFYPIVHLGRVVDHMLANPDLYTPDEVATVLKSFEYVHNERRIALPAISTLVETEGIVNDTGELLRNLYPEMDHQTEG